MFMIDCETLINVKCVKLSFIYCHFNETMQHRLNKRSLKERTYLTRIASVPIFKQYELGT